ncbi:NAD-dependent epimerase/dehydratase family protein [Chitinimonas lacunae]|uniref:NAD-dependent epimerase/dehydratase family protein n=1 Tax=Chitinimonas lacunae TaxID=1963018 RepID=A0ABV8MQE4_9NEIS
MQRLLIVGCGDVMRRALPWLCRRFRVYALARSAEQAAILRSLGAIPLQGDLDRATSLRRLAGLAHRVIHSAPPAASGNDDPRTRRLLAALARGAILPRTLVYISTTGVYGNSAGAWIDESAPLRPESPRALRRVAAEQRLRQFGRRHRCRVALLRAPGIYAEERLPLARLRAGTPALIEADDGYSNHIHADDLARAACLALFRGRGGRAFNIVDDSRWKMGEWFDQVADAAGLPHPPRLPREAAQQAVDPALWSFMRESRRLRNGRMKRELKLRLAHPTPTATLQRLRAAR